jgi:3-oxoacyl-[acyl-carrier-protein] synthase-3
MAFLRGFGSCLPPGIVTNAELAPQLGVDADWILTRTGIHERRYAAPADTVVTLGVEAALSCLEPLGTGPDELGMILVASGSPDRYCPGPAASIAAALGLSTTPALDLPIASAGSLAALALASRLAPQLGNILVLATEIMSRRIDPTPAGKETAVLFGDGAGAALVSPDSGFARILDSSLHTDGNSAEALKIEAGQIYMEGSVVIRHALRRMPGAILEVLDRNDLKPSQVAHYLFHQANAVLLQRISKELAVPESRFFANIARYGNTSSASLLIAAAEWRQQNPGPLTAPMIFSAFGAGFNWGALLAVPQ